MSLESMIRKKVKSKNFRGIIVSLGNQSEVSWWDDTDNEIKSLTVNFKVEKSLSFSCEDGKFKVIYI
ncbi:MAG: hypothetical protein CME68_04145 [Halobacteriovoraceae bacterium]|nr:hypothetical protein [Halobacteriovoraceae bacterium]